MATSSGVGVANTVSSPGANAYPGWQSSVLGQIGAPVTKENIAFLDTWHAFEQSSARNNPLNTTQPASGATNFNSVGVKNYPSGTVGTIATAQTLQNGNYPAILSALRSGNPLSYTINNSGAVTGNLRTWGSVSFADALSKTSHTSGLPGVNVLGIQVGGGTTVSQGGATVSSGGPTAQVGPKVNWEDFLGKLSDPNTWIRIIEIAGGGLLVLLGLYLIAKDLGLPTPSPPAPAQPVVASVENTGPEPLSQSSRTVRRRAGFELASDRRPRRGEPGSSRPAQGETIPF